MAGSRRTAARVTPGAICLSSSSHFAAQAVFETHETGGVAARPRQAIDKAGADRIGDCTNTIGTVRVACSNGATAGLPVARMTSGASATNSAAYLRMSVGIARGPADVDPHVAADGPAQLLQPLQERRDAGLTFRIVRGEAA